MLTEAFHCEGDKPTASPESANKGGGLVLGTDYTDKKQSAFSIKYR
jgi:hypothetical protein